LVQSRYINILSSHVFPEHSPRDPTARQFRAVIELKNLVRGHDLER
jgi:hypothetical protein